MAVPNAEVTRVKGETIVKPLVYGNAAKYFGKKREEDNHTHSWILYIKPYLNEDMSKYVRKVVFKLHDSYQNPMRILTDPPYEVRETGWGEFEAVIKIFFQDPAERHVTIYHTLKLFNADPAIIAGKKLLVNECYDEIVFQDPTLLMFNLLTRNNNQTQYNIGKFDTDFENRKEKTLKSVLQSREELRKEINDLKDCLKESKELINKFRDEINKAEQDTNQKMSM